VEDHKLEAYLRNLEEELEAYSVEPYFASKGNTVIIDSDGIAHVVYVGELAFKNEKEDRGNSIDQAVALFYWKNMNTPEIIGETVLNDANNDGGLGKIINKYNTSYYNHLIAYPQLGIDANDNLYLAYAAKVDGAFVPAEVEYFSKRKQDEELLIFQEKFGRNNIYADVFMIKLLNGDETWQGPLNVTNAPNSEETFPSIPRNIKDTIMLIYQHDDLPSVFSYSQNKKNTPNINIIAAAKILPEDINNNNAPPDSEPYVIAYHQMLYNVTVGCDLDYKNFIDNFVFGLDYPDGLIKDFTVEGDIDFSTPGKYPQQLFVTDSKDNQSDTVNLTVNVKKNDIQPTIVLKWLCDKLFVIKGSAYTLPEAIVLDKYEIIPSKYDTICDISPNLIIDDHIDINKVGTYKVIYSVDGFKSNESTIELPVEVVEKDKVAPEIHLYRIPTDTLDLIYGSGLVGEIEVYARDAVDCSNISVEVEGLEALKNAKKAGVYKVTVTATDQSKNQATDSFTVVLKDGSSKNNTCENATSLEVAEAGFTVCETGEIALNLKNNTFGYEPNCYTSHYSADAFYKFEVPKNGNIAITGLENLHSFTILEECDGNELFCLPDILHNKIIVNDLPKRKTVILHILGHRENVKFCIENVKDISSKNINCKKAQLIEITPKGTSVKLMNNSNNLEIEPACIPVEDENSPYKLVDNFYKFEVPSSGIIKLSPVPSKINPLVYMGWSIYKSCNGETLHCSTMRDKEEVITNLPPGEKVILQLYYVSGIYNLEIKLQEVRRAKNDLCKNAELIGLYDCNHNN